MFTTLTIAMTLTGAVAVESPAMKADASRPALIQVAQNEPRKFGKGNISSGGRERRSGIANNGGPGIFGANLATPPGGFANGKGSNRGNAGFANGKGSNGGNAGFANGKGSNGGNTGFANGVGSNAPAGYKTGVPAQSGYTTGAPTGYPTGQGPQGYSTGQPQGYATGYKPPQGPILQPPANNNPIGNQNGNGNNTDGAVQNPQQVIDVLGEVQKKG